MTDAYETVAKLLMRASVADRMWILSRLSVDERIRIAAAMQDTTVMPGAHEIAGTHSEVNDPQRQESFIDKQNPVLATVDSGMMNKLLANEPDWIIALFVGDARWPWVESYLAGLDPHRLEGIERWVRAGRGTFKPKVTEALTRLVVKKLAPVVPEAMSRSAFEAILERVKARTTSSLPDNVQVSA